eukprot:350052-Chlamydomonas_euryale.AAC.2
MIIELKYSEPNTVERIRQRRGASSSLVANQILQKNLVHELHVRQSVCPQRKRQRRDGRYPSYPGRYPSHPGRYPSYPGRYSSYPGRYPSYPERGSVGLLMHSCGPFFVYSNDNIVSTPSTAMC